MKQKYYIFPYHVNIIFDGIILEDKDVKIDTNKRILYHKCTQRQFIRKYMNEKWFNLIRDYCFKKIMEDVEKIQDNI